MGRMSSTMTIANKPRLLVAFIVIIGTLDLTFTLAALHGGWLVEQNPIADRILSAWGAWGLAGFKAIVTSVACAAIWVAMRGWAKQAWLLTVAVTVAVVLELLLLAHWVRCFAQFL